LHTGAQASVGHAALTGRRILIAEDLPDARVAVAAMLQAMKLRVDEVGSAAEALVAVAAATAAGDDYDVVLLDQTLPHMDGCDAARRLAARRVASRPAIVLLASAQESGVMRPSYNPDIAAILVKPVLPLQLEATIAQVLDGVSLCGARDASPSPAEGQLRRVHRRARILVAEDNPVNQQVLVDLLRAVGLDADVASTGREAVRMAGEAAYDLILMDMHMPEMDGVEATRSIRRLAHADATPIVAVTANAFSEDRLLCLAAGMNDHIAKPVDPKTLYDVLLRWLPVKIDLGAVHGDVSSTTTRDGDDEVAARLAGIPGLDVELGRKRVGGRNATYVRVLRQFIDHYANGYLPPEIMTGAGDARDLRNRVHSLKGASGTVGVTSVQVRAAALELAMSGRTDAPELAGELRSLDGELVAIVGAIEGCMAKTETEGTSTLDAAELHAALDQFEVLLANSDFGAGAHYREIAPALRAAFGEDVRTLARDIGNFDFERALTRLRALRIDATRSPAENAPL
jgi:CheY-like chemotaxis protein